MAGELRVGTSGWQYDEWAGTFYPEGLPRRDWLPWYAGRFDAVEVNNTFYRLPRAEVFEAWRAAVPPGFLFALKYSRFGSHMKKLKDPEEHVARYLGVAERLGDRMGPILVQLPPNWRCDTARLDAFLAVAPRRHRWAVELRHESWLCDAVLELLARHGAALCVHDLLADHPFLVTADFTYVRYHGTESKYRGGYPARRLAPDARWMADRLAEGLDVHAYFNNDLGGHAVRDAARLLRLIGTPTE